MEVGGTTVFGLFGVALYLGSYAALQFGWLHGDGVRYALANLCAASLVLLDLQWSFNLPSALIQCAWICISLFGLMRIAHRSRWSKSDSDQITDVPAMPTQARHHTLQEQTGQGIADRWRG